MFTTKPESGEKITKLGGGDAKTPFTERPATYASKSPGPSASKMVPSIIGEDLTIRGNVIKAFFFFFFFEGDGWYCGRGCCCARPRRRIDQGRAHYAPGAIPSGR